MSRIRITGGEWRSRLINVPDAKGLRPTPDRVRETLFNWLGQDLTGLVCLDAFAGSGILGFEAASRGAEKVVMVERAQPVFAELKRHAALFGAGQVELFCADAVKFAAPGGRREDGKYDILFLDPPYGQNWLQRIEPKLDEWLAPDSRIYVEAEAPLDTLKPWRCLREKEAPGAWTVTKQGRAGQVCFHLLERT